jgi:hypothetical protein
MRGEANRQTFTEFCNTIGDKSGLLILPLSSSAFDPLQTWAAVIAQRKVMGLGLPC